jgi:hypothetical protein
MLNSDDRVCVSLAFTPEFYSITSNLSVREAIRSYKCTNSDPCMLNVDKL